MMTTPFFPALRARLAAQGKRAFLNLRQLDFPPLMQQPRQRLPPERLEKALAHSARTADQRVGPHGQLPGRPVKVVDGSTAQWPDTQRNQQRYPQPSSQKRGCGFPLIKFLVLFSLRSGAILRVALGHWKNHDRRLWHGWWDALDKGDILLGDRACGECITLACLPARGVDVVARLHGARQVDYRKARKRLGRQDALFQWHKGYQRSEILSAKEWKKAPGQIPVRILRFDAVIRRRKTRITRVTTLLDPVAYPAHQLAGLYARRWHLELALRHLKTSMGMELLRCQSPDMAEKELLAYLVAYNMIRCRMAQAAAQAGVEMDRLSFKGAVNAVRPFTPAIHKARSKARRRQICDELLRTIVRDLVPLRPHRQEPRAVKRRPKAYPLLNKPRHKLKEIPHRSRFRKAA